MKQLQITNVSKQYSSKRGSVVALSAASFTIQQGEFVALLGPSGCGKSTLLRVVAGLLAPDNGSIEFHGWTNQPRCRLVFQGNSLFPWMTVIENVAFGLEMDGVSPSIRLEQALALLSVMGMADCTHFFPHELSGGMHQRTAIARAFITSPDILLMDEPLRALDAQMRFVVQEELLTLWGKQRPIVLYVTHDIEEALLLADRVLVMSGKPGCIRQEIQVPFDRPRDLTGHDHPRLEELKWHIWTLLEADVRSQLQVPISQKI